MTILHYDTIVLGSGNAGMAAAGTVRADGGSVAVVEHREVGGTCPIRGCVPKKVLVAAGEVLHQIASAQEHQIRVDDASLCWPRLIERKHEFVDGVADDFAQTLKAKGVDLYQGSARFTGSNSVTVAGRTLRAETIVIATGSRPRHLDIDGSEYCLTSEELLVDKAQPESLIAIGGGVISLEFGHVLARAGTRVTILEAAPAVLPKFDHDLVRVLTRESERIGIRVQPNASVKGIFRKAGAYEVRFTVDGGKEQSVSAEKVLNGTGRVPDVADLSLEAADVAHTGTQIIVNDFLRSVSNPRIYVAGDALHASPQLSPLATYEGRIVGRNIVRGQNEKPDYDAIPSAVFTVPTVATVGLTEAQAEADGLEFSVKANDMTDWRSARTHAETAAFSKVLLARDDERVLGAHMVGHGSGEIIHLFALAMRHGITAAELREQVYAYPTFASDIKYMV